MVEQCHACCMLSAECLLERCATDLTLDFEAVPVVAQNQLQLMGCSGIKFTQIGKEYSTTFIGYTVLVLLDS